MKKLFILVVLFLFSLNNFADNYRYALGLNVGSSLRVPLYGANFKCFLNDRSTSALDFMLNYQVGDLILNSFYEFHKESRKSSRQFKYINYYGGLGFLVNKVNEANRMLKVHPEDPKLYLGPALIVGFELGFPKMPLMIGVNLKPMYNIMPKNNNFALKDARYNYETDYIELDASIRYIFK